MRETVNIAQAITLSGKCRRTVYRWIREGLIETEGVGENRRIYVDTLPQVKFPGKHAFRARPRTVDTGHASFSESFASRLLTEWR